jgi:hypothetical protein
MNDMIIIKDENKSLLDLIQFIDQDAGQNRLGRQLGCIQNGLDFSLR